MINITVLDMERGPRFERSDTPRTNAAQHNMGSVAEPHYVVDVEVACDLERELAEAQAEIVRLTKRKDECSNGWDGALATVQRLERELVAARAELTEKTRLIKQMNTYSKEMYLSIAKVEELRVRLERELAEAKVQRDKAKVCEQPIDEVQISDDRSTYLYKDWYDCAAAIRAMKESGK